MSADPRTAYIPCNKKALTRQSCMLRLHVVMHVTGTHLRKQTLTCQYYSLGIFHKYGKSDPLMQVLGQVQITLISKTQP